MFFSGPVIVFPVSSPRQEEEPFRAEGVPVVLTPQPPYLFVLFLWARERTVIVFLWTTWSKVKSTASSALTLPHLPWDRTDLKDVPDLKTGGGWTSVPVRHFSIL